MGPTASAVKSQSRLGGRRGSRRRVMRGPRGSNGDISGISKALIWEFKGFWNIPLLLQPDRPQTPSLRIGMILRPFFFFFKDSDNLEPSTNYRIVEKNHLPKDTPSF